MLSRDNLVNGARRVLVHGGDVLNSGMVQRRVKCTCSAQTKTMRVDINARYKNCTHGTKTVWWILARDIKVVRASYWHDREVIHSGFKVHKA
jgi:hypothetical protein